MRTLKLQMNMSLNFITNADPGNFNWDDEAKKFALANTDEVDHILLGRKTAEGFIPYWASVATRPDDPEYAVGKKMTDIPKIVLTNTLIESPWPNTELAKGGIGLVSSLIKENLIDRYYLVLNPFARGNGETIFQSLKDNLKMTLLECRPFEAGSVLLVYEPKR